MHERAVCIHHVPLVMRHEPCAAVLHRDPCRQGLCYHGGFLYESTGLFGGKSSVRKVNVDTGEVLQSVKLGDKYFGEGMVIFEDKVHNVYVHVPM